VFSIVYPVENSFKALLSSRRRSGRRLGVVRSIFCPLNRGSRSGIDHAKLSISSSYWRCTIVADSQSQGASANGISSQRLARLLESLTGQRPPHPDEEEALSFPPGGLGYSQLNELLLLLGYDRVTQAFFQFLVDGTIRYQPGAALQTVSDLERGVERVRKLSLLFFGNVKFGFKKLARDVDELSFYQEATQPIATDIFRERHQPIHPVAPIPSSETYYLGYFVEEEVERRLGANPLDEGAAAEKRAMERVRESGIRNHRAYLISDHLDVYVATSMRQRHEYREVAEFTNAVFNHPRISDLKLRWFDPTQAYCPDRIDKGLAEA